MSRLGHLLVALQFGLLGALAILALPRLDQAAAPALAVALALLSAVVGAAAVAANRPGNFNVHPEPRAGGRLVEHGVYRWVRHPMYLSVLLAAAAAVAVAPGPASGAAAAALAAVLGLKSSLEERWMAERHPGYAAYRRRTRRFVPWLL